MQVQRLFLPAIVFAGMVLTHATAYAASDVQWTFGNNSFFDYELVAFNDKNAPLNADLGSLDPTLTLRLGVRYQVTVLSPVAHPFEVIAKGANAGDDTALLTMGTTQSPFETNSTVNWVDTDTGTVAFTLAHELASAMLGRPERQPGYRCTSHTSTMRANVVIVPEPAAALLIVAIWVSRLLAGSTQSGSPARQAGRDL